MIINKRGYTPNVNYNLQPNLFLNDGFNVINKSLI